MKANRNTDADTSTSTTKDNDTNNDNNIDTDSDTDTGRRKSTGNISVEGSPLKFAVAHFDSKECSFIKLKFKPVVCMQTKKES